MKNLKKSLLILSIPAITMIAACEEQKAYAPEVKEDISVAQEIEDPAESAQEEQEAKEDIERQAEEQAEQEAAEAKEIEEAIAEDQERVQGHREAVFLEHGRESMIGVMNIEFSPVEKTYYLYPIDPMIVDEIHNLAVYGQGIEDWNYMVESLVILSEAAQQVVGDGYTIMLMNPVNGENILVMVRDGQIIYDAIDEL